MRSGLDVEYGCVCSSLVNALDTLKDDKISAMFVVKPLDLEAFLIGSGVEVAAVEVASEGEVAEISSSMRIRL